MPPVILKSEFVPPYSNPILFPLHVPDVIVPTEVRLELTTVAFNVVPDKVPAGAITTDVPAAVINPLPFTVKLGIAVELPKLPTLAFTVANVVTPDEFIVMSPLTAFDTH